MTEEYKLELRASPIYNGEKAIPIKHNGKWGFFVISKCKFIEPQYDADFILYDGPASVMTDKETKLGLKTYENDRKI